MNLGALRDDERTGTSLERILPHLMVRCLTFSLRLPYGCPLLTFRWGAGVDQVAATVTAYDALAPEYAERWFHFRLDKALARFQDHVQLGSLVLDAGCGPGRDTQTLQMLGYRVLGIDCSIGMLREGRRRGVNAPLVQADLRYLPLPQHSLDGIWACASLLHLPKTEVSVALAECARVLNHGCLYLAVKEGEGEGWETDRRTGLRRYFAYYYLSELKSLLERSGFQVLEHWIDRPGEGQRHPWINVIASICGG